jgi:hypothetical protein
MEKNMENNIWTFTIPDNNLLVILLLWIIGFMILYFSLYRVLLKNQIRQGVHPHILSNTLILLSVGGFLLVSFLSLDRDIGLGWFGILAGLYTFFLLIFIVLGKALRPLIFFLVIMAAIIAFRLVNV